MSQSAVSTAAIADMVTGPAAPVGALVEELPHILDAVRVASDQAGHDMVLQIARDAQLAAVEGRVAKAVHALVRLDLQR